MIHRSTNAAEVGALIEKIGSPDGVTTADLAASDNWHAWVWGGGVFVVLGSGDSRMLEVHTYVFPTARGKHAVAAARTAIACELDEGYSLIGRTPMDNLPARRFAALCGGRVVGVESGEEVRVWVN